MSTTGEGDVSVYSVSNNTYCMDAIPDAGWETGAITTNFTVFGDPYIQDPNKITRDITRESTGPASSGGTGTVTFDHAVNSYFAIAASDVVIPTNQCPSEFPAKVTIKADVFRDKFANISWTQGPGPEAQIFAPASAETSVTIPQAGLKYQFNVTASDIAGNTATGTVTVSMCVDGQTAQFDLHQGPSGPTKIVPPPVWIPFQYNAAYSMTLPPFDASTLPGAQVQWKLHVPPEIGALDLSTANSATVVFFINTLALPPEIPDMPISASAWFNSDQKTTKLWSAQFFNQFDLEVNNVSDQPDMCSISPAAGVHTYSAGENVALAANVVAGSGGRVHGWLISKPTSTEFVPGTGANVVLDVKEDTVMASAICASSVKHVLTAHTIGAGQVTVCPFGQVPNPNVHARFYNSGSGAVLFPIPDDGFKFVRWSGPGVFDQSSAAKQNAPLVLTMNIDRDIVAEFSAADKNAGVVKIEMDTIDPSGHTVKITAIDQAAAVPDLNHDGVITDEDVWKFADCITSSGDKAGPILDGSANNCSEADFNRDGIISDADKAILDQCLKDPANPLPGSSCFSSGVNTSFARLDLAFIHSGTPDVYYTNVSNPFSHGIDITLPGSYRIGAAITDSSYNTKVQSATVGLPFRNIFTHGVTTADGTLTGFQAGTAKAVINTGWIDDSNPALCFQIADITNVSNCSVTSGTELDLSVTSPATYRFARWIAPAGKELPIFINILTGLEDETRQYESVTRVKLEGNGKNYGALALIVEEPTT